MTAVPFGYTSALERVTAERDALLDALELLQAELMQARADLMRTQREWDLLKAKLDSILGLVP